MLLIPLLDWIKNVYFPKQTELLQSALKIVTEALDSVGVEYIRPKAGLFIMADLRKVTIILYYPE